MIIGMERMERKYGKQRCKIIYDLNGSLITIKQKQKKDKFNFDITLNTSAFQFFVVVLGKI